MSMQVGKQNWDISKYTIYNTYCNISSHYGAESSRGGSDFSVDPEPQHENIHKN